jgi:hypothetical protein
MRQLMVRQSIPAALPEALRSALLRYEAWRIRSVFGGCTSRMLVLFLIPALLGMLVDRFFDFSVAVRAGGLAVAAGLAALPVIWLVLSPVWYGTREVFAAEIDAARPGSRDALRSTLNLLSRIEQQPGDANPFLLRRTVDSAGKALSGVNTAQLVDWGRTPRWLAALGATLAVFAVLWLVPVLQMSLLARRFLNPWGNYPRPSLTRIIVDAPEKQTLLEGDDCAVNARLAGRTYEGIGCFLHVVGRNGRESVLPMSPRPGYVFATHHRNLSEPFRFCVTAGDGRSESHEVGIIPRPKIVSLVAQYKFPRYTRLPPSESAVRFREIKAVEGTRIRVMLETDQPIEDSWVEILKARKGIRWDRTRRKGDFTFVLERSGNMGIHLVGRNGTANKFDAPYILKAIQDNPPSVSFIEVPETLTVYQDDLIRFSYRGTDDFGIEEVFIRYKHSTERESRSLSLQFPETGAKMFQGEAAVEVRELTDAGPYSPPAEGFELCLVMVDGKDQPGTTQKVNFRVIVDAPDSQYTELNGWLLEFNGGLERSLGSLRSVRNQMKILVEGMDDAALSPKHQQMLDQVRRELPGINFRDPYTFQDRLGPNYRYGSYPFRAGRAAEELMTVPFSFFRGGDHDRLLAEARGAAKPKAALQEVSQVIEEQIPQLEAWQKALLACVKENRIQVVSYVLDQWLEKARRPAARLTKDVETRSAEEAKQAERLATVAATIKQVDSFGSEPADLAAGRALQAISDQSPPEKLRSLFEALQAQLLAESELDGRLQRPLYEWLGARRLPQRCEWAEKRGMVPALRQSLTMKTVLRGDNHFLDEAEFLLDCLLLQRLRASQAQDLKAARDFLERARPWAQAYDVLNLARLIRRDIVELQADRKSGRLKAETAIYQKRWLELRELFLALTTELKVGVYGPLPPSVLQEIQGLAAFNPLFQRWHGLLAPPDYDARVPEVVRRLDALVRQLEPVAEAGLRDFEPKFTEILPVVCASLSDELLQIASEIKEIAKEVAEASGERLDLLTDSERRQLFKDPERRRSAKPERPSFAVSLVRRLETYSLAFGQVVDFREQAWAKQPSEATTDWIRAAENVSEMLRALSERVYDKAAAPHFYAQFTEKAYPAYVQETGVFYEGAVKELAAVIEQIRLLAAGNVKPLLESAEFRRQLSRIDKQKSYRQTLVWVESHVGFVNDLREAGRERVRLQAVLNKLANARSHAAPYWRSVFLALDGASRWEAASRDKKDEFLKSTGSLAQAVANLHLLVDGLDPLPEEMKKLPEALGDFDRVRKRLVESAGASGDAATAADDELKDWQGTVLAVQEGIEARMAAQPVQFRLRRRYGTKPRFDIMTILNYLLRNESRWLERVRDEEERTVASRVAVTLSQLALGNSSAMEPELAWQVAYQLSRRRRSMTAQSQSSQGVPLDLGGEGTRVPKMPQYLYEELRRSMKKNYPQHFRDMGLKYIRGLSEDAF